MRYVNDLHQTVTPAEFVWTMVAVVGVLIGWAGFRRAYGDRSYVRTHGFNGVLNLVTNENVRSEGTRLAIQVICFTLGCSSMFTPSRTPPGVVNVTALLFAVGFILIEVMLVWSSLASLRYKRRIVDRLVEREAKERQDAQAGGRRKDDRKPGVRIDLQTLHDPPIDRRDTLS